MSRKRKILTDYDSTANNHSYCDACGEAGKFICCDGCPRSFHFSCLEPPMDEDNLPPGDWYCNSCAAAMKPPPVVAAGIYTSLMHNLNMFNPLEFSLPHEITKGGSLCLTARKEDDGSPRFLRENSSEPARKDGQGSPRPSLNQSAKPARQEGDEFSQDFRNQSPEPQLSSTSNVVAKRPHTRKKYGAESGLITQQLLTFPAQNSASQLRVSPSGNALHSAPPCQRCMLPIPRETMVSCGFCATKWHCECTDPPLERPPLDGEPWICNNHAGGAARAGTGVGEKKRGTAVPQRVIVISFAGDETEPHAGPGAVGFQRTESSVKLEFLAAVKRKRAILRNMSRSPAGSHMSSLSTCLGGLSLDVQHGSVRKPGRILPNGTSRNVEGQPAPGLMGDTAGDDEVREWLRSMEQLHQDVSSYLESLVSASVASSHSLRVSNVNNLDILLAACKTADQPRISNGHAGYRSLEVPMPREGAPSTNPVPEGSEAAGARNTFRAQVAHVAAVGPRALK